MGTQNLISQNASYTIPAGYHNGAGRVQATYGAIAPGEFSVASRPEIIDMGASSPSLVRSIRVGTAGTYRVKYDLQQNPYADDLVYAQIYVNGVARGIQRATGSTSLSTYVEDISVNANDEIQLYAWKPGGYQGSVRISNFSLNLNLGFTYVK